MIRVTAAVIERAGRLLLARRGPGMKMAGKWEFPGGKIEPGEAPEACLRRELQEELGVEVAVGERLGVSRHAYADVEIELLAYAVRLLAGEPTAREHDRLVWVLPSELLSYELAEADVPIARVLMNAGRG